MSIQKKQVVSALIALALFSAKNVFACAACAGASDSDLAKGMNWGIFTLLCVVLVVLGGFAAFFIYLVKRSAANPAVITTGTLSQTTQQI
jgi:hypothetical protein